mgnify:CR=1 FL=1
MRCSNELNKIQTHHRKGNDNSLTDFQTVHTSKNVDRMCGEYSQKQKQNVGKKLICIFKSIV